jgi:hypothetical protein
MSILSAVNTVNLVNTVNAVKKPAAARRRCNADKATSAHGGRVGLGRY